MLEHEGATSTARSKGKEVLISFWDSAAAKLLQAMGEVATGSDDQYVVLTFKANTKQQQAQQFGVSFTDFPAGHLYVVPSNMLLLAQAVRTRAVETLPFYMELAEMMKTELKTPQEFQSLGAWEEGGEKGDERGQGVDVAVGREFQERCAIVVVRRDGCILCVSCGSVVTVQMLLCVCTSVLQHH